MLKGVYREQYWAWHDTRVRVIVGKDAVGLPDDLVSWVEEVGGGVVVEADRRPGGARKEAWFVDLRRADGTVPLLLALRPL